MLTFFTNWQNFVGLALQHPTVVGANDVHRVIVVAAVVRVTWWDELQLGRRLVGCEHGVT